MYAYGNVNFYLFFIPDKRGKKKGKEKKNAFFNYVQWAYN